MKMLRRTSGEYLQFNSILGALHVVGLSLVVGVAFPLVSCEEKHERASIPIDCRLEQATPNPNSLDPALEADYLRATLIDPDFTVDDLPAKRNWHGEQSYEKARELYEQLAAKGYERAKIQLAAFLLQGKGGPADIGRAMDLYVDVAKSSVRSEGDALVGLSTILFRGVPGVFPPQPEKAMNCLRKAGDNGDPQAQLWLGAIFTQTFDVLFYPDHNIPGTPFDPKEGERWLLKAADNGVLTSYKLLSWYFYYNDLDKSGKPDLKRSEHYARVGASKGSKECLLQLEGGYKYETGKYGADAGLSRCYRQLYGSSKAGEPIDLDKLCPPPNRK